MQMDIRPWYKTVLWCCLHMFRIDTSAIRSLTAFIFWDYMSTTLTVEVRDITYTHDIIIKPRRNAVCNFLINAISHFWSSFSCCWWESPFLKVEFLYCICRGCVWQAVNIRFMVKIFDFNVNQVNSIPWLRT